MTNLNSQIKSCQKCPLYKDTPCGPVPGIGPDKASLMIVGEALGEDESIVGEPFVGLCGRFLDKMLDKAGLIREEIYITNAVKCLPTKNNKLRTPSKKEINACKKWLWLELTKVAPQYILTMGRVSTELLLHVKKTTPLKEIIGRPYRVDYSTAIIVPCYHPSYIMVHSKKDMERMVEILYDIRQKIVPVV